jgi:hypothetical protein
MVVVMAAPGSLVEITGAGTAPALVPTDPAAGAEVRVGEGALFA